MMEVLDYYDIDRSSGNPLGVGLHELKLERKYEDQLVAQFLKYKIFDGNHPDQLCSLINKDVVPKEIEVSLLNTQKLGHSELLTFVRNRFLVKEGKDQPDVAFTATMSRTNPKTFANLFDVSTSITGKPGDTMKGNRNILQRVAAAYEAGQPVDLKEVVKSESLSVPLSIFKTDRTMRTGNKADFAHKLRSEAGLERTNTIPFHPAIDSKVVIDGPGLAYKIYTKNLESFSDFSREYRNKVYSFPSKYKDVHFDRYENPTPKGQTQENRKKGKSKGPKKKFKMKAVEKVFEPETELPSDMDAFFKIEKNKIRLQQLLGEDLIKHAPADMVITVYGAFEEPTEVRCSDPTVDTEELESDHVEADSRMILSKNTEVSRIVYFTEDTDFLLIALAQDFAGKQVYMQQRQSTKNSRIVTDMFTDVTELTSRLQALGVILIALLLYYALTGCDTVSYLFDQGKVKGYPIFLEFQVK